MGIEVRYINHCGNDLSVVNAARVSFHKESELEDGKLSDKDVKLVNYLAKHQHKSPFNHCFISLGVKAPIFVARQLVKHKFMPWNEVSRRYVDEEPEFYMPVLRQRADKIKQGSSEELSNDIWDDVIKYHYLNSAHIYSQMLDDGVAPECARAVLPQTMMTEWIWSGTLGAWADMLKLRLSSYTQKETREVALKCYEIIQPLFPISLEALLKNV